MAAWDEIEGRHGELKTIRAREEATWRELARFLRPDGQNFDASEIRDRNGADDPFDSTPLYALDDFVGGTFVKSINPAERYFKLAIADKKLMEFAPVKQWLWNYTSAILGSLDPSRDNFYLSAPAWFADKGAFGTGFLWQEEWVGQGKIISQPMPIGECFKDVDFNGETDTFHREFMRKGRQLKDRFGRLASELQDNRDYKIVHAIWPNPAYRPGNPFQQYMRFRSCYVSPDAKNFIAESGYNSLPVHEIEWSKRSGRAWATGPGHNALADMRGNDEMERIALAAMQFEAEPMLLVQDEDIMTAADIAPHGLIYGGINENGKQMVAPLKLGENLQLPMTKQEQVKAAIRRAFHFGLSTALAARPQMTATEVLAFQSDELKQLAPNLVRIYRGVGTFMARRAALLGTMMKPGTNMTVIEADVGPPPPELSGQNISIEFESPFTKAQKSDAAKGVLGWVNTKVQLQASTSNPAWMDDVDVDGVSNVIHDAMTGVPDVKLDPRVVAQNRQQRAQAMAQQQQVEQQERMASIVADVSHANQAQTSAQQRGSR